LFDIRRAGGEQQVVAACVLETAALVVDTRGVVRVSFRAAGK
jgi:hypothetical protein